MPSFLVPIISAIGTAIGGNSVLGAFLVMSAETVASAVLLVGGLAYSAVKAKQAKRQARDQYNASQVDRLANVTSAVAPRELVLGRVRKAGAPFYKASTGPFTKDLYIAIALAGHEIDAVEQIYLNDTPVTLDSNGFVTDAPYWPYVKINVHLGGADQVADAELVAAFPADWPSANTVQGVAYITAIFTYFESAFPNGAPNVTAVVRGAKLFDPRTGLTQWSENPALMMRHVYQHPKLGKATVTTEEDARFAAAANACDASTSYVVAGVTATQPLYRAALVLPFGAAAKDALDDLCQAMAGSWAFAGGELYLKPGVWAGSVMALADADLAVVQRNGTTETQVPIKISVHKERAQKFNTVKPTIWDQAQDYKQTPLTPLVGAALLARDGVELVQEVTFPAIGYAPQALHVAGVMMRDARDPLVVELPFKLRAYPVELFDTVDLTLPRYGWVAKTFMVIMRNWNADGSLALTLKETTSAIFQMDAAFAAQGYALNTNLPQPWTVEAPGSPFVTETLYQTTGSAGLKSRATIATAEGGDISIAGYLFEYRLSSASQWTILPAVNVPMIDVADMLPALYEFRVRAENSLGVRSDYSDVVTKELLGLTAPPGDVSNLSVYKMGGVAYAVWALTTDLDVRIGGRVVLRHSPLTSGAGWNDGVILEEFSGDAVTGALPLITGTYMAKFADSTGNFSATAASFVATEGMVTGYSTVATSTQAPTFPGTKTNTVVASSKLQLSGNADWDTYAGTFDSWPDIDALGQLVGFGSYLFDTYIDMTTVATRRLEAVVQALSSASGDDWDSRTNTMDDWDDVDGAAINDCDATLYVATTDTDPAGSPVWSAWNPFFVTDVTCRAMKFKLELSSANPTHQIAVSTLTVRVKS